MLYAKVAKIYSNNESALCEIVTKGKDICASFDFPSDKLSESQW